MAGQIPNPEAMPPQNCSRRRFVGGLFVGGACGSLATAQALRGRPSVLAQNVAQEKTKPSSPLRTLDHERFMREAIAQAKTFRSFLSAP
jgi:hypothetical protein